MPHSLRRASRIAALSAALGATAFAASAPPTAAQTTPPPALRLEAAVWGSQFSVPALPGQFVEAEVRRADGGRLIGYGSGGNDGRAVLDLFNPGNDRGPSALRSGDTVRIAQSGRRPVEIPVPALSADVDTAADRLSGTAPAGATVAVLAQIEQVGPDGGVLQRDVPGQAVAGADGAWSVAFGAQGVDLPAGRTSGRAWVETADHDRFIARFVDARMDVALGAFEVRGAATPGRRIKGTIERPGADPIDLPERTVVGDGAFTLGTTGGNVFGPPPPNAHAIAVGDRIVLTVSGPGDADQRMLALTVPPLALQIDAGADRVSGTAAAGALVRVDVTSMDDAHATRAVRAAADGAFSADFAGAPDLGPGWLARASVEPTADASVGAVAVVPQTRAGIGLTSVQGLAEPGTPITVTMRAPSGAQRRLEPSVADATGRWGVNFADFLNPNAELEVRAGDRIEIASVDGDPLVATVPALTALADADRDTVGGTAPPGARLRVTAAGQSVEATADGAGRWTASFSGRLDLAAPLGGEVWIDGGPFAFFTTWSVVRLTAELGSNFLTGNGPRGRAIAAVLRDGDGRVAATATGRVFDPQAFGGARVIIIGAEQDSFYLDFFDVTGQPVPVQAGDILQVTAGDQTVSLVVPALEGAVFVKDDVVSGRTRAGSPVRVRIQRDGVQLGEGATTADANGTFSHRFGPDLDIRYNDVVQLEAGVGDHRVTRYISSPGIQVDLDRGSAQGTIGADTRVRIELRRAGLVLAGVDTQTGPEGFYWADLHAAAGGRPIALRPGDIVTVTPVEPPGEALTMTLPELTVDADVATDVVGGKATAGGSLAVLANDQVGDSAFGFGQAWPEIAGGAWRAEFVPAIDVRPGLSVNAQYRTDDGHVALRTRVVPLLNVEHGGPNVCGWTAPSGAVTTELRDANDRAKGAGSGEGAWWDGAFHAVLHDAAGAPVTTATSDTVRADLSGAAAQLALPPLDLTMDWAAQRLTGRVPKGTAPEIQFPAQRCGAALDINGASVRARFSLRFGGATDGRVDSRVPLPIEAGQGFEVALRTAGGHRVYRQFWRGQLEAYLDSARAAGTTNSLASVALTLLGADGAVKGTASGAADPAGRFDLTLRAADGAEVRLSPGDRLTATAGGDSPALPIDSVAFDWSPGGAVAGTAPAGRSLRLTLRLADGRRLSIDRSADDGGRWSFGADEVPIRGGWDLADVVAVRAALLTPAGHAIIAQSEGFEAPDEPPAGRGGTIYLPALLAKASFGAARAASNVVDAGDARPSALRPIRPPVHEAQARPRRVDGAHLVVHEAPGQADRPDRVFVEVRRDAAGALGPRNP